VWKLLYSITGKFYSIYLLQMVMYWLFVYLLLFRVTQHRYAFATGLILATLILFIPQYIIANTHTAISWGISFVLMVLLYRRSITKYRTAAIISALLMVCYGTSLSLNNISGAIVLLYLLVGLAYKEQISYFKKTAIVVAISAAIVFSSHMLVYKVL